MGGGGGGGMQYHTRTVTSPLLQICKYSKQKQTKNARQGGGGGGGGGGEKNMHLIVGKKKRKKKALSKQKKRKVNGKNWDQLGVRGFQCPVNHAGSPQDRAWTEPSPTQTVTHKQSRSSQIYCKTAWVEEKKIRINQLKRHTKYQI